MSTTSKKDRFFALMGALLFLISASALTIAVVYDSVTNKDKNNPSTTPTTSQQTNCDIQTPVSAAVEKLPAAFEAKNADVKELKIEDLSTGAGAAAKKGDCLNVKYYGTLAKDGTKFDENFTQTSGLQLQLGAGQVISGWEQGLVGMKVGGVRRLVIPSDLAYGSAGQGSIPPNATLVFLVKLVAIK